MTHTICGETVNHPSTSCGSRRPYIRKKVSRRERRPSLVVSDFALGVVGLNPEQRGFVISLLDWHWDTGREPPADFKELGPYVTRSLFGASHRALNRIWANDDVRRAFNRLRIQRQPVTEEKRERVWNKTGGYCWHCNVDLTQKPHQHTTFHVDHLKLVRFGGTSHIDNLVPACRKCNLSRSKFFNIDPVNRTMEGGL